MPEIALQFRTASKQAGPFRRGLFFRDDQQRQGDRIVPNCDLRDSTARERRSNYAVEKFLPSRKIPVMTATMSSFGSTRMACE